MGRVSKMVSFDNEKHIPIIKKMPEGMLSKVCQKAIEAWGSGDIDMLEARKEIEDIEEQENSLAARKKHIREKLIQMELYEKKQKEREEWAKKKELTPEERDIERNVRTFEQILSHSHLEGAEARSLLEAYRNSKYSKISYHMDKFIVEKGYTWDTNDSIKKKAIMQEVKNDL